MTKEEFISRLREEAGRMLLEGNLEQQAALAWAAGLAEDLEESLPPRPCTCGQGLWLDHEQGPYCG